MHCQNVVGGLRQGRSRWLVHTMGTNPSPGVARDTAGECEGWPGRKAVVVSGWEGGGSREQRRLAAHMGHGRRHMPHA
jgi:hypothetical protein